MIKKFSFLGGILWLYTVVAFIVNAVKLIQCDFDAPYKEEVIHAIGIFVPPVSWVTCWL
jgi:hypothetical protein